MITDKQKQEAHQLAHELSARGPVTAAEGLSLILQAERNEILKTAFVTHEPSKYPNALEAIAMALGYTPK